MIMEAAPAAPATPPAQEAGNDAATTSTHWLDSFPDDATYEAKDPKSGKFAAAKLREHPKLREFKDVQALAKSFVNQERALGKKGLLKPDDSATEEQKAAYAAALREHLGVPENADSYELPKDMELDPVFKNWFLPAAHQHNLPPSAVTGLLKSFTKDYVPAYWKQFTEGEKAKFAKAIEEKWGKDAPAVTERAKRGFLAAAVNAGSTAEEAETIYGMFGNHPELLRIFAKFGETVTEDTIDNHGSGAGPGKDGYVPAEEAYLKKFGVKKK